MNKYFKKNLLPLSVVLILCLIGSIGTSFVAVFLQRILDAALTFKFENFYREIIFTVLFFSSLIILSYFYNLLTKWCVCKIMREIRNDLYKGIIKRSYEKFIEKDTANYLSNFTNDLKIIEDNYLNASFAILENTIIFLSSLVIMIYYSPTIALFTGIAILLMILIPSIIGIPLQNKQNQYSTELSSFTGDLKDSLLGFEVIKSFNIEKFSIKKFIQRNCHLTTVKYKMDKLFALNEAVSMLLSIVMQIGIIGLSAYFLMQGEITVGVLMAVTQLGTALANPLMMIFENLPKIQSTKEIIKKLEMLLYTEKEFSESSKSPSFESIIRLDNLCFSYGTVNVLENIDLVIEKGKKYAIVGKNGCGKSTLIKLISGYFSEYDGSISYDNVEINSSNRAGITQLISIIHQNVYVFNESVKDNICLHNEFSDADIEWALKKSGLDQTFNNSDLSLDYIIKENGQNLSGGQKQRIAVARAIIQKKPFLILDEGTSAIEQKASKDIEQKLFKEDSLTLLAITHKLNEEYLNNFDEIIVLDNGTVLAKGTYLDLLKHSDFFKDMIEL